MFFSTGTNNYGYTHDKNPNMRSAPRTFPGFPRLPIELRSMIWSFSMLNTPGRHISLIQGSETDDVVSTTPPPTLLSVCALSRLEAKKHYRKLRLTSQNISPIWVNFTLDTFQFDFQLMADSKLDPADLASLVSLELAFSDLYNWLPEDDILPKLVDCENLRYLKAVYPAHGPWNHEGFCNDARFTFEELADLIEALQGSEDDNLTSNNATGWALQKLEIMTMVL